MNAVLKLNSMGTEVKFPCVSCTQQVEIKDHPIQCELCKSWEHIREVDRPSEGLYAMLSELQCNTNFVGCLFNLLRKGLHYSKSS